ncbi:hypothetical protein ACFSL6_02790 [Paenibacillus thailandensis]|uniref:Uncharacterized protein n=1 Tax=Paenibacillus thailandensis TaxID=393250 RepID=A0ABW5QVY7_9BACL
MEQEANESQEIMITEEEWHQAVALFNRAYPYFIDEIERVEAERGKLNDFQLMLAVSRAKERLVILGWNCRKALNAIFDRFVDLYRTSGKEWAEDWAEDTFGSSRIHVQPPDDEQQPDYANPRIHDLRMLIQVKEAELLLLYQELVELQDEEQASRDASWS